MIVLQGTMPNICKRCKKSGGLEDGLYIIHTEEDFVNFYCDGQSPKTCPIKGEIPDKHGDLKDADVIGNWLREQHVFSMPTTCKIDSIIKDIPIVISASEGE